MNDLDAATIGALVTEAAAELGAAEAELQRVLGGLLPQERADKSMITAALREILGRVSAAHQKLEKLRPGA